MTWEIYNRKDTLTQNTFLACTSLDRNPTLIHCISGTSILLHYTWIFPLGNFHQISYVHGNIPDLQHGLIWGVLKKIVCKTYLKFINIEFKHFVQMSYLLIYTTILSYDKEKWRVLLKTSLWLYHTAGQFYWNRINQWKGSW